MPNRNPEPKGELGEYYLSYGNAAQTGPSRTPGPGADYEDDYLDGPDEGEYLDDDLYEGSHRYGPPSHHVEYYDDEVGLDGGDYEDDSFLDDEGYYVPPRRTASSIIDGVLSSFERLPSAWMSRFGPAAIRIGVGLLFVWYGALLLQPGLSPIDELVRAAFADLFELVGLSPSPSLFVYSMATVEVGIGVMLLIGIYRTAMAWFLILHMAITMLSMALVPELIWDKFPHAPTAEGQYVISNLILIAAAMVIGASARTQALYPTSIDDPAGFEDPGFDDLGTERDHL